MDDYRLSCALNGLGAPRILVLGDLILDRYTWGDAERISQEAPVVVLRADNHEYRLGGAANVANMAATLGAQVTCIGAVGADHSGQQLCDLLAGRSVDISRVAVDAGRPTTLKERFMGRASGRHASQMLRVDTESSAPLPADIAGRIEQQLPRLVAQTDAVLVADYAKGVCIEPLLGTAVRAARWRNVPILVDPGRFRPMSLYHGATLIKPNRRETELAAGIPVDSPTSALAAAQRLCRDYDFSWACITLDADGMALAGADGTVRHFPTRGRRVYDITGAGDMVLSMLGMCMAEGIPAELAVQLANVAAGLEVERHGVAAITREEIDEKLRQHSLAASPKHVTLDEAASLAARLRAEGRRTVFTNGCFDLLHVGHVNYLAEASRLGDVLFVAVNSDASVRRLKGPERPVIGQRDRAAMLAALACVDYVLVFEQETPHKLLQAIRPDVLVKGGTYTPDEVVGREVVTAYGGQIAVTAAVRDVSTTQILSKVAASEQSCQKNEACEWDFMMPAESGFSG